MASGRVIVGHAYPTIKEVLEHDKTAFLVKPHSFEELQLQLGRALEVTYPSKVAEAARKLALEKYTWSTRAAEVIKRIDK